MKCFLRRYYPHQVPALVGKGFKLEAPLSMKARPADFRAPLLSFFGLIIIPVFAFVNT